MANRREEGLGDLHVLNDEIVCNILECLPPKDVGRLSCVSSVLYIFCNEEPLWMKICLQTFEGDLEYKASWKTTTLQSLQLIENATENQRRKFSFQGLDSLFLYRRWYRCHITLENFDFDNGAIERRGEISKEDFSIHYDGIKPVLLTALVINWKARYNWTLEKLTAKYGDVTFRISQSCAKKITMRFKNYASYINLQHDEDPLYIFDAKFGEVAPDLLKDYEVPPLFQEDLFSVIEKSRRPPFRWLVLGPARSGASWHVDPALTSAWNTLLEGRKRWALYPPGRIPPGVTVHVNEDDGDINIESPSSLQWWLDVYPLLEEEDKPIECTQLPGETIFLPSGWWHCVLNLDTSIAVTQNFVNEKNFCFVCLDLAPGYCHKGIARSGWLALQDRCDDTRKENNGATNEKLGLGVNYSVETLSSYLDEDRDQYGSEWSDNNVMGQRDVRVWLHKLWATRPELRELIWKGSDIVLNAGRWLDAVTYICTTNCLAASSDGEKLPVGHGSNPVYMVGDHVIKIYVEGGIEAALYSLGSELEFHDLLIKSASPLRNHVPCIVASGILCYDKKSFECVTWDGKEVPPILEKYELLSKHTSINNSFSTWNKIDLKPSTLACKKKSECDKGVLAWPYLITKKCIGEDFSHVREKLSKEDHFSLAVFLGEQVQYLHSLPLPPMPCSNKRLKISDTDKDDDIVVATNSREGRPDMTSLLRNNNRLPGLSYINYQIPTEWQLFTNHLRRKRENVKEILLKWGECPGHLIDKVESYLPHDPVLLLRILEVENGQLKVGKSAKWLHMDIMDDNIHMEPYHNDESTMEVEKERSTNPCTTINGRLFSPTDLKQRQKGAMKPSHILDFSDMSIGDPIYELIAIYLDVFRGNRELLKCFLEHYKIPFFKRPEGNEELINDYKVDYEKLNRVSYHAMCYCILHEDNVLGTIFSIWEELKNATSWEQIEDAVWGSLNALE